jgi:hypothetical protein
VPNRKLSSLTVKNSPSPNDYVVIVDAAETNANQKEKLTPVSNFDQNNQVANVSKRAGFDTIAAARLGAGLNDYLDINIGGRRLEYVYDAGSSAADDTYNVIVASNRRYVRKDKSISVITLAEFQALDPNYYNTVFFNGYPWMYNVNRNRASLGNQGEVYVTPNGSTSGSGAWEVADRMARSNEFTLAANATFTYALNPIVLSDHVWRYHQLVSANTAGLTLTLQRAYKIYNAGAIDFTVVAGSDTRVLVPDESITCHVLNNILKLSRG